MTNPYGVDLAQFPLLPRRARSQNPTFVMAGTWCLRKGCDLLLEAVQRDPELRLLHVGSIGDIPFPEGDPRIRHIAKVDQGMLSSIYAQADAFVLASREEGLSNVITQALASGLPIVCTYDTGGGDLRHTATLRDRISVVKADTAATLADELRSVHQRLRNGPEFAPIRDEDRNTLSWRAFAKRYEFNLLSLLSDQAPRYSTA